MYQELELMQFEVKELNFPVQENSIQYRKAKLFYGYFGDQDWKSKFVTCLLQYNDTTKIINYVRDGEIIRIEKIDSFSQSLQNGFYNFQQIKNLRWEGSCIQNKKVGKWNAFWKGENLNIGGLYDSFGKKVGPWIEIFENYWDLAEITYQGEYLEGKRVGYWKTIYQNKIIGGGQYNQKGQRIGKWIELYQYFSNKSKVFFVGQYKVGFREGYWEIIQEDQLIGGGLYNEKGMKLGLWIELLHHFNKIFYIVQIGEYYKENKCGKWKIFLKDQIIGGGIYNKQGAKQGKWIELHEKFHEYCWVTLVGEYENGKKIGQWDFIYQKKIIAGGIYLQNGLKNGNWRELSTKFNNFCLLLNEGCYLNGKKFQYWNIISYNSYQILGGGSYNLQGYKNGKWITFNKNYYVGLFSSNCISQVGEYKQGRKHNHWDIINNENEKIGGGEYDHKGMKFGQWTELHQNFWDFCKVTLNGNYYNGHKLGNWEVKYKPSQFEEIQIIGGGMYNENYQKNNKWIELDENFSNQCENGFKVGKWTLKDKNNSMQKINFKGQPKEQVGFTIIKQSNKENGLNYQSIIEVIFLYYIPEIIQMDRNRINGKQYIKKGLLEEEHIKTIVQKVDNGLKSKRVLSINPFKLNKEAITMEKNMGFGIS